MRIVRTRSPSFWRLRNSRTRVVLTARLGSALEPCSPNVMVSSSNATPLPFPETPLPPDETPFPSRRKGVTHSRSSGPYTASRRSRSGRSARTSPAGVRPHVELPLVATTSATWQSPMTLPSSTLENSGESCCRPLHRDRELVNDLQGARQHREGGGL